MGGKEKRKRKLDEIVMGLSAAKEQKTFSDPSLPSSKKQQIPPSVTVTPANQPSASGSQQQQLQQQKPFSITVTSVPGKREFSPFLLFTHSLVVLWTAELLGWIRFSDTHSHSQVRPSPASRNSRAPAAAAPQRPLPAVSPPSNR